MYLIVYESTERGRPEMLKAIKLSENLEKLSLEQIKEKSNLIKKKLNSDNPILAIYSDTSFSPKSVIKRVNLPEEVKEKPDEYLKPMDIV